MLLIILLVLIALRIFKNLRRSFQMHRRVGRKQAGSPQEMVSCHRCGTYIVKSNAIFSGSNHYCSENCLKG
jgi:hypothetical protein